MTLQTATTAKTASDAAVIFIDETNSLVVTDINTEITTQSTRTDTEERIYRATLYIDCEVVDDGPVELIQSDETKVNLFDVEETLKTAGYRINCKLIKTRDGIKDKIKLDVAWS